MSGLTQAERAVQRGLNATRHRDGPSAGELCAKTCDACRAGHHENCNGTCGRRA